MGAVFFATDFSQFVFNHFSPSDFSFFFWERKTNEICFVCDFSFNGYVYRMTTGEFSSEVSLRNKRNSTFS